MTASQVKIFWMHVALAHDSASDGSRAALAALIADVASMSPRGVAAYLRGLASAITNPSPARKVRVTEIN